MNTNEHYKDVYTEAAYGDAVAILRNGVKMSIQEILDELNSKIKVIVYGKPPEENTLHVVKTAFDRTVECKSVNIAIPRTKKKNHANDDHFITITIGYGATSGTSFSFRDATSAGFAHDNIVQALTEALEDYQSGADHE